MALLNTLIGKLKGEGETAHELLKAAQTEIANQREVQMQMAEELEETNEKVEEAESDNAELQVR